MVIAPVPAAELLPRLSVPPATVVPPVYVLVPVSVSVPVPVFIREAPPPLMTPDTVLDVLFEPTVSDLLPRM